MKEGESVLLVYSVSHALKIEKLLKSRNTACRLIPVPRHLSSDCGICIKFSSKYTETVSEAAKQSGIETAGIFIL
ncbi:MAG: DUF3343 domain-containing protein [Spirochaetia bacterium]|nr:DUF3343 domain-containing protein [Spirochaetia bacterium]